jgi:hypothetical protein
MRKVNKVTIKVVKLIALGACKADKKALYS